jgi:hypothetical protein
MMQAAAAAAAQGLQPNLLAAAAAAANPNNQLAQAQLLQALQQQQRQQQQLAGLGLAGAGIGTNAAGAAAAGGAPALHHSASAHQLQQHLQALSGLSGSSSGLTPTSLGHGLSVPLGHTSGLHQSLHHNKSHNSLAAMAAAAGLGLSGSGAAASNLGLSLGGAGGVSGGVNDAAAAAAAAAAVAAVAQAQAQAQAAVLQRGAGLIGPTTSTGGSSLVGMSGGLNGLGLGNNPGAGLGAGLGLSLNGLGSVAGGHAGLANGTDFHHLQHLQQPQHHHHHHQQVAKLGQVAGQKPVQHQQQAFMPPVSHMLLDDPGLGLNLNGLGSAVGVHRGLANAADFHLQQLQQQSHHRHHM